MHLIISATAIVRSVLSSRIPFFFLSHICRTNSRDLKAQRFIACHRLDEVECLTREASRDALPTQNRTPHVSAQSTSRPCAIGSDSSCMIRSSVPQIFSTSQECVQPARRRIFPADPLRYLYPHALSSQAQPPPTTPLIRSPPDAAPPISCPTSQDAYVWPVYLTCALAFCALAHCGGPHAYPG